MQSTGIKTGMNQEVDGQVDVYSDLAWEQFFTDLQDAATAADTVEGPNPQLVLEIGS